MLSFASLIRTGPRSVEPTQCLADAMVGPVRPGFVSSKGALLVTIQATLAVGGQKDAKYEQLQTSLAQALLEQGISLSDSAQVVDKLLPQAGAARVQRALAIVHPANRWQQISDLCTQFHVAASQDLEAGEGTKAHPGGGKEACPGQSSALFQIQPDYCYLQSGDEAERLQSYYAGCRGLLLIDAGQAEVHLKAATCKVDEELAFLVIGQHCPCPSTCQGQRSIAAFNAWGNHVCLPAASISW